MVLAKQWNQTKCSLVEEWLVVLVAQSCPTPCDPTDCSPPGYSVHGILQARVLEWTAIPFSRGSSWPRDQTRASCIAGRFFTIWATGKTNSWGSCLCATKDRWLWWISPYTYILMGLQNMTLWHIKYLKLKDFDKMAEVGKSLRPPVHHSSSLSQAKKQSCVRNSTYTQREAASLSLKTKMLRRILTNRSCCFPIYCNSLTFGKLSDSSTALHFTKPGRKCSGITIPLGLHFLTQALLSHKIYKLVYFSAVNLFVSV